LLEFALAAIILSRAAAASLGQCWRRVWAVAWVARHSAAVAVSVDSFMIDGYRKRQALNERRWREKIVSRDQFLGVLPYPAY
jgi:hypothetical protein